jgi:anti-anti-sigma factor
VKSAHERGGQHDLTSEAPNTSEVDVSHFPTDSLSARTDERPPRFECSSTNGRLNAIWIRVTGALDIATTPQLERTLRGPEAHGQLVVLDLTDLASINSSGVHAIVDASVRARHAGSELIILRGSSSVDRMLALTEVAGEIRIGDRLTTAEPSVGSLQRSLVSSSLLKAGGELRGHRTGR